MRRLVLIALVVTCSCAAPVARAQIVNTLRAFPDSLGWAAALEGFLAVSSGNSEYFEFDLDGAVQYRSARHRVRTLGAHSRREAEGTDIARNTLAHLRHNYQLCRRVATVAFVQAQRNPFRRVERRTLLGGGLRLDVFARTSFQAAVGATVMREVEELTDDDRGALARARMSYFASVLGQPRAGVQVDLVTFYQPLAGDYADARAYVAASLRVDIVGGLYFAAAYDLVHDADPPAGVAPTDQRVRSGLGWRL
jgi:putative salt-induced outer membrane protein YdiY